MNKIVVTITGVLALAIAMATVAFGAQTSEAASAFSSLTDTLARAALQTVQSGEVAGVQNLPSTTTGGTDGMAMVALALGSIVGGFVLIKKAITDR